MTDFTKLLTEMIGSRVCGRGIEKVAVTREDMFGLYNLAKAHDLAHLLYDALCAAGAEPEGELAEQLKKQKYTAIYRHELLRVSFEAARAALEAAEIDFLPLKGTVLRGYYPEAWMRTSCDIDLLVREGDVQGAIDALGGIGFEVMGRTTHDVGLRTKNGTRIELHYTLVEDDRANACSETLKAVWDHSSLADGSGHMYKMTDSMFYFYHVAHMAKHIEEGGCGIRPFLDMWILNHRTTGNENGRRSLLEQGNLLRLAEVCRELSEVWFDDGEHTDTTLRLQSYIITGGVYGSTENKVAVNYTKKGGKVSYMLSRIFVPYEKLKLVYPALENKPLLTPIYQIKRWARIIRRSGLKRLRNEMRATSHQSDDRTRGVKEFLSEIGID